MPLKGLALLMGPIKGGKKPPGGPPTKTAHPPKEEMAGPEESDNPKLVDDAEPEENAETDDMADQLADILGIDKATRPDFVQALSDWHAASHKWMDKKY